MLYFKLLDKQEQENPKMSRREIIKIKAEINEIETNKQTKNMQSWFFEKINKIDRPLANLTKMRREKILISKMRNAKGEKTTPGKSRKSSETTLRMYILINLKILKKWTYF
jgi:hypothetical protein